MRQIVSLLALAGLLALIWFAGGYFGFSQTARIVAGCVVVGLWVLTYAAQRMLAIRSAMLIERRLREQADKQIAASRPMEREALTELRERIQEAIDALKSSKLGKTALAELPWYVIIGPPGSGKTTALRESGLDFPLRSQGSGLRGIGGTRNCEWWFTNDGILLDTAGRYTTQDEDREEWQGFLSLIKDARSRKPINGAIVAISVADILEADDAALEQHANSVRDRLDELCRTLEEVFPVYVMFTKCDLMPGFVEFFEDYSREQRAQVWGHTFRYRDASGEDVRKAFERECKALYARLTARRLPLLAVDRHPLRKQRLYAFPLQFAAANQRIGGFLERLFAGTPFKERPILRGFYFSSGTQEGDPIDRVLGALAEAFGAAKPAAAGEASADDGAVEKKSYFIHDLFTDVIFKDRGLATSSAAANRRRRRGRLAAASLGVAATLLFVSLFVYSYLGNRQLIARVDAGITSVQQASSGGSMTARLEALERVRGTLDTLQGRDLLSGLHLELRWGLYQGGKLEGPVRTLYFEQVRQQLVEPCLATIAREMRALSTQDAASLQQTYGYEHEQELFEELYLLMRAYLMLTRQLEPVGDDVKACVQSRNRWLRGIGVSAAASDPPARDVELAWAQFDYLMATQADQAAAWQPEADQALLLQAKTKLEANFWISQTYTALRDARVTQTGKDTLATLLPQPGRDLLQSDVEVSQIYTAAEWEGYFQRAVDEKSGDLAEQYATMRSKKEKTEIAAFLRQSYEDDGRAAWRAFFDDLRVAPFADIEAAADGLAVWSSRERSPLPALFADVWVRQAFLDYDAEKAQLATMTQSYAKVVTEGDQTRKMTWTDLAHQALGGLQRRFSAFVSATQRGARVFPYAQRDGLSALDPLRDELETTRNLILDEVLPRVPTEQRAFAQRLLAEVLAAARDVVVRVSQQEAEAYWSTTVFAPLRDKVLSLYPFVQEAQREVAPDDLARFFRPEGGLLWESRTILERLLKYRIGGAPLLEVSDDWRRSLSGAEALRDALFGEGEALSVPFEVKLIKRSGVRDARLQLGEQGFKQSELPPGRRKDLVWGDGESASVSVLLATQDEWARKEFADTRWGLPRLLAAGTHHPERTKEGHFRYTFQFEVADETFLIDADFKPGSKDADALFDRRLFPSWSRPPERLGAR